MKRHLAAFEAGDRNAFTALLALLAAASRLALARTDTPADPHAGLAGTIVVADFIKFHELHSLSLLSRVDWKRRRIAATPVIVTPNLR